MNLSSNNAPPSSRRIMTASSSPSTAPPLRLRVRSPLSRSSSPSQHAQQRRSQSSESESETDDSSDTSASEDERDEPESPPRVHSEPDELDEPLRDGAAELQEEANEIEGNPAESSEEEEEKDASLPTDSASSVTPGSLPPSFAPVGHSPAEVLACDSAFQALWLAALPEAFGAEQFHAALERLTTVNSIDAHSQGAEEWSQIMRRMGLPVAPTQTGRPASSLPIHDPRLATFAQLVFCAKYLVHHQLRSHYGAALPTLAYVDRILTSNYKSRPSDEEGQTDHTHGAAGNQATHSSLFASRIPLQRILLFTFALEQLIHHCGLGSSVLSPPPPKSRDFFSANFSACTTFFDRIRGKLIQSSLKAEWATSTVYHARLYLPSLARALRHIWRQRHPDDPSRDNDRALTHADLLGHKQLLETVYDLSRTYIQMRNPSGIAGLHHWLRARRLAIIGASASAPRSDASLASLCFYLRAAELQSRGAYESAIDEYKHVLDLSCTLGGRDAAAAAATTAARPLLLINSIAIQACIHGLTACHLQLAAFDAMETDMRWSAHLAARWESMQAAVRSRCPTALLPLLPSAQTVRDFCRWPVQSVHLHALSLVDHLTRRPSTSLTAEDLHRVSTTGAQLREYLLHAMLQVREPTRGPFLTLTAEQQASMSESFALLALMQRMADVTPAVDDDASHSWPIACAQSMTHWQQSLSLASDLGAHRVPVVPPVGWLANATACTLTAAMDASIDAQCAQLMRQPQATTMPVVEAVLAHSPVASMIEPSQFHWLRRVRGGLALSTRSVPSQQDEFLLTFAEESLRSRNFRLAASTLRQVARTHHTPAVIDRADLLNAILSLQSRDIDSHLTGARTLMQIAFPDHLSAAHTDAQANQVSYMAACHLLELAQSPSPSHSHIIATILRESHSSADPIDAGSDTHNAAIIVQASLQAHPTSVHMWLEHARMHFLHSLQLCAVPHDFQRHFTDAAAAATTATATSPAAAGEEAHGRQASKAKKKKKHQSHAASASTSLSHHFSPTSESNRCESDEDYLAIASLIWSIGLTTGGPQGDNALALLSAVIVAINSILDATDDAVVCDTPGATPPPPEAPQSVPEPARRWFDRLHVPLWHTVAKVVPQMINAAAAYVELLSLASQRAVRVVAYADCALRAFIQAAQLLALPTTHQDISSRPTVRTDIPVHVLTLVTRFGGELMTGSDLPGALLTLPHDTFLHTFPQLFARASHSNRRVRSMLHALIALVGESFPHQVVFPICVALHEEEDWRRESDRCMDARDARTAITPKHDMIMSIVRAIDKRSVSTMLQYDTPDDIITRVVDLFVSGAASPSDTETARARSTFSDHLNAVHRMIVEMNRLAFLWEDSYLHELRRIQTDMELSAGPPPGSAAVARGSRAKLLQEEVDHILSAASKERRRGGEYNMKDVAAAKMATVQQLRARYSMVMAPILHQLRELKQLTLVCTATTPHEARFQRKYAAALTGLMTAISQPTPEQLHRPLQLLWTRVHAKIHQIRKTMVKMTDLRMRDVSPILARWMANTANTSSMTSVGNESDSPAASVPATHSPMVFLAGMQGTEDLYERAQPIVDESTVPLAASGAYVHSFHAHIEVLRTKTRPKKLSVAGSDGRMHTFLLKNREDLHLDQRMMQVIRHTNRQLYGQYMHCRHQTHLACMCAQSAPSNADPPLCHSSVSSTPLYARTFAVVPLSDKSGLIKWVDGVSSIFDLYKSEEARRKEREEQARLAATKANHATAHTGHGAQMPPVEDAAPNVRTSDVFAHCLGDALQSVGLRVDTPRADVPLPVLVRVYEQMRALSSPSSIDLLRRELWLSSAGVDDAYAKQRQFVLSLAVMSIVGYVIGLGDRHLGNIMVHLGRGDVLHIDYNISLDRGLKLPIPEVIPFRLTPILTALCDDTDDYRRGTFYHAACSTMAAMRHAEPTITALIHHTFLAHPFAEWKPISSRPIAQMRKQMDLQLTKHMREERSAGQGTHANRKHKERSSHRHKSTGSALAAPRREILRRDSPAPALPAAVPIQPHPADATLHEERNRHGIHAVRRIQQKLCGLDPATLASSVASALQTAPASATLLPVTQQVDRLIAQATDINNLARLYEGWAPWI